jgi:hypothetical protein
MRRILGLLIGLVLLALGGLLALYGLFAILYGGDSGASGDTYVKFDGHEIDADLVGAIALFVALFAVLGAITNLRMARRRAP